MKFLPRSVIFYTKSLLCEHCELRILRNNHYTSKAIVQNILFTTNIIIFYPSLNDKANKLNEEILNINRKCEQVENPP